MCQLLNMEEKSAYPYITKFKKEPFRSFVNIKRRDIWGFYYSGNHELGEFYKHYNQNLLKESNVSIENVFWFLFLRKFLKEDKEANKEELFQFIKSCELRQDDKIGFKLSPHSQRIPDIYSTYLALSSLKNLGLLKRYLLFEGQNQIKGEIREFILSHKKGNVFLHCLDKDCDICKKISPARTTYYVIEIFTLLGIEIRANKKQFRSFIGDRKRGPTLVFRYLCLKFLDLDLEVKDKEIQYFHQFQKESGGFNFDHDDNIDTTFWVVYILELYSWLLNFNPAGIYRFINHKLNDTLSNKSNWNSLRLNEVSKLVIIFSIIWKKFINEIESVLFKQLEKEKYVDLNQIKTTFGLSNNIEEIISYINLNYNFNLKVLNIEIEFNNYLRNLSQGKRDFFQIFYKQINQNSVVSITDILKKFRAGNQEPLKLKEEVFPIVRDMVGRKFFKGSIRAKKGFLTKAKYYFYVDNLLKGIIVSDTEINSEILYEEKEKMDDIKNDIYNMTLKLKYTAVQIREEIDSYLLINETAYARERLKFILRDSLMEADFLNENIENSFNEELYYLNIQAILGSEISQWKKHYSVLQKKLSDVDLYLRGKIQEKEELRNLKLLLENLNERIIIIEEDLEKKLDIFRRIFSETFEKGYNIERFNNTIQDLDTISHNVNKYDNIIYKISQQITTQDKKIAKKHKKIIDKWISIKIAFDTEFSYYTDGFQFFNSKLNEIKQIEERIKKEIIEIEGKAKNKINENQFQEAFTIIKNQSDLLLNTIIKKIKELYSIIKIEIKNKQKLYLLYRHLQDSLEALESNIIDLIAKQGQTLKNKITEEQNRAKIEDFDAFISQEILTLRNELSSIKNRLVHLEKLKVETVDTAFDNLRSLFNKSDKLYTKKSEDCLREIENFRDESKLKIIQWEKFSEFFTNELVTLKGEIINGIIANRLNLMALAKKTNNIKLIDLRDELKLSCKILIKKVKNMIDISMINAEINEENKFVLVYTEDYYRNKELNNYLENHLLKDIREKIGKILALYDSSIRNRTLNINMLELQNRVKDLKKFEEILYAEFSDKARELQINQERYEYIETKSDLDVILVNNKAAIENIKVNLNLFNRVQNFIDQQFISLKIELKEYYSRVHKEVEKFKNYLKIQQDFENKEGYFNENLRQSQDRIEEEIRLLSKKTKDSNKMVPEMRELFVNEKNTFQNEFEKKIQNINDQITVLKNSTFREQLLSLINNNKIQLSQLLGNLERKVEDNIDIKEFKRSIIIVQKRAKDIDLEIKNIKRMVNNLVKEFNRQTRNFSQISKFILEDFNKFISEYSEILSEKIKALERLILKSYIEMTIKAVANEYLTIGFLNNELKIKKANIQNHLLYLISTDQLNGKYDPRFGIYYENPEVLDEIDESELEVIKNTNFRVVMALNHLKNFTSQYGSVIAFFASILTISYYLFLLSGGNPASIVIPIVIVILVVSYFFLKRHKKEEIT